MKKTLKIRPIFLFLIFLGLGFFIILSFIKTVSIEPGTYIFYVIGTSLFVFMTFFFFWIYIIGIGFNELDKETGNDEQIKKFCAMALLAFVSLFLLMFFETYFVFIKEKLIPEYLKIPLSLLFFYCYMYIVIKLTNNFKFYDKKETPRIFDYFVTMFLLSLFPFGLLIMHSHLRKLLKEEGLLNST